MTATTHGAPLALGALRLWFGLDALVTGVNAIGYLALASVLDGPLGADAATYRWIGAGLLVFSLVVGGYARATDPAPGIGRAVVAVNAGWVAASLVVAATGALDLEPLGRCWVVAQAAVVAALTVQQARAQRSSEITG